MSLINPWLSSLTTELEVHQSLFYFLWVFAPAPLVCPYIYSMAGCVLRQSRGVPCPSCNILHEKLSPLLDPTTISCQTPGGQINTAVFAFPKKLCCCSYRPQYRIKSVVVDLDHQTTRSAPKSFQQTQAMERRDDKPVGEAQGRGEMIMIDVVRSSNNTQTIMPLPFFSFDLNPWSLLIIMTQ